MTNGSGKNLKNEGSLDLQSSSRIIDKRVRKGKKQKGSRIAAAPIYAYAATPASTGYWATVEGETLPCNDQGSGYIFMCNGKTKVDCYKYKVFGLPTARMEVLEKIKPYMKLFLFDFDLKLLYGIYIAASNGKLAIEPAAFGGKFSAQVRFEIFKDCLPLPESAFKHVIADNYRGGCKFRQELSSNQVDNLILLFRPAAAPSPVTAGSLMPKTIQPATIISQSIEIQTRPAAELSASYDQYLAGLQPTDAGAARDYRHAQLSGPFLSHAAHASVANMDYLQPPLVPHPQHNLFYPSEAHQAYVPENTALHSRYTARPYDAKRVISQQSDPTIDCYKHETVLDTTNAPVQAHALVPSQFSTSKRGHAHLPSSSLTAAYWAQVASMDPKQVYSSSHQWIPSASTGLEEENIPISYEGIAPAYPAVQENRDRETVLQSSNVNDYNHNVALAATNAHVPQPSVMPLQFQTPLPEPAHSSSSPSAAVYWTARAFEDSTCVYSVPDQRLPSGGTGFAVDHAPVSLSGAVPSYTAASEKGLKETVSQLGYPYGYHHNTAVSSANVLLQAHAQQMSQVLAPIHGSAHLLPSVGTASYWTGVAYEGPSQVYLDPHHRLSSGAGAANIYSQNVEVSATSHVVSSSEVVASEDTNQVYSGPH